MSDLHNQHRVQFVTPTTEGVYDDDYKRLRNYYAPLANHTQPESPSSPPSSAGGARGGMDRVLPVAQNRTRASSSGSESFPSPEDHHPITALYPPPATSPPSSASVSPLRNMHDNNGTIIDQSRAHDSERVIEISPDPGRYLRLNSLLGKGAYKIVYKAIDREEGYEVAWNAMQAPNAKDSPDLAHEIQILKSVRHPNIIAFHDAWHTDNEFVFITELMTSGTLREYIRKLSLPNIKIVKRWVRQILKGLSYLHGHNPPIIHRDIKCDNIFINGAYGEVKIGDMGTAKMKMGKKYTVIGTPEFMAPEMYEESGYSEKVDIYAFGMCLLEMATGEYPYGECTNPAQIYKKVMAGVKPVTLGKVQNQDMLAVIENCLGPEDDRMSAQQILEHALFVIEPEVVLLTTDESSVHLTLQVVFKGVDKRSVKFDFNVEMDTPDEVVTEMIEENILPERYQRHITKEISRILREWDKDYNHTHKAIWRREAEDYGSELEKVRHELQVESEQLAEKEAECDDIKGNKSEPSTTANEQPVTIPKEYSDDVAIQTFIQDCAQAAHRGMDKAQEWIQKLQAQDIMTVGDLRHLQDEDWEGIGLTVFALRAIKNMLKGKQPARHTPL
ncbi:ser thr protein kinase [Lichtheimia corymbifera JMRC:FSU:9682]|uniref:non-specific serine/threonine protein kinase n=1 Tax=Lichtheimia corymbifera JMRC:FSU:9682 TaxID=1263082 RepID=A0A068RNT2_9FUNG|nr:ser thr protein kinase [Lichtheimia corymbifera JMRC:FSU:9682]